MWKSVGKSFITNFLNSEIALTQQIRTVFLFKRRYPTQLHKKGEEPHRLKPKHYIYDLIKNTDNERQRNIDVILTSFVSGLGNAGDRVSVPQNYGYNHLLLPRLAVYATPENLEKYKDILKSENVVTYSTPTAKKVIELLEKFDLSAIVSKENPWTLKPWHIRAAFRRSGIIVPEEAIEMPPKEIKGPDMSIEQKEFYVTVTINKTEKVKVRCRIHHWSKLIADRLPPVPNYWKIPHEPVYPEFASVLEQMPSKVMEGYQKEEEEAVIS